MICNCTLICTLTCFSPNIWFIAGPLTNMIWDCTLIRTFVLWRASLLVWFIVLRWPVRGNMAGKEQPPMATSFLLHLVKVLPNENSFLCDAGLPSAPPPIPCITSHFYKWIYFAHQNHPTKMHQGKLDKGQMIPSKDIHSRRSRLGHAARSAAKA